MTSRKVKREINEFHGELVGFLIDFRKRFTAWYEANPVIDEKGRKAMRQALYLSADGFAKLFQRFDRR